MTLVIEDSNKKQKQKAGLNGIRPENNIRRKHEILKKEKVVLLHGFLL